MVNLGSVLQLLLLLNIAAVINCIIQQYSGAEESIQISLINGMFLVNKQKKRIGHFDYCFILFYHCYSN